MFEVSLNLLTTDELFNLMIIHTKDMLSLPKTERGKKFYDAINKQVQLIQKVLAAKRGENQPMK